MSILSSQNHCSQDQIVIKKFYKFKHGELFRANRKDGVLYCAIIVLWRPKPRYPATELYHNRRHLSPIHFKGSMM